VANFLEYRAINPVPKVLVLQVSALYREQTRHHGFDKVISLDVRKFNIACGRIDIDNTNTAMTRKMQEGILQTDGSVKSEANIDVRDVGRAVVYMASLPLDTDVPL
jgi:NADP-dependent 3-hydroxy acid dehydrogenase YdfG